MLSELVSVTGLAVNNALSMDFDFTYRFTNASASNKLVLMTSDLRGRN